ncbi:hypothetical protein FRC01_003831 [Tulasnella sp. 417]|nr:hypothetical protein FRC01_003831 [Tulasnella sp. 417]
MNTTFHAFEQPITQCPEVPARFGDDGGKFHYYYDQLADELDEDLTKRLKSQLDSLLIFAGLFAGVNSAFLALTLPMMSADPADDTNALLLQLVKGENKTINSEADLPSSTFSPPPSIYPVNVLFAVSLTCALMSSFLAVLGQQWLVYYRKRSGGGAEHQRKEQLRRQLGAQRWQMELVLDDVLPALLQVGLVIFCIAFVIYLGTLSSSMSSVIAAMVGTALVITVGAAVCATWDRMCPYQSPLSHLLCWTLDQMKPAVIALVWLFIFINTYFHQVRRREGRPPSRGWRGLSQQTEDLKTRSWDAAKKIASSGLGWVSRKEETADDLAVASVKRVILTSEHTNALIHAAINLCAIDKKASLQQLMSETEFLDRLHDLFSMFCESNYINPGRRQPMREAAAQAFASAILHMTLSVGTLMNLAHSKHQRAIEGFSQGQQSMPYDLRETVYLLGRKLEGYTWREDTGHMSYLRLFGVFIVPLIYYPGTDWWGPTFQVAYTLHLRSESPVSHQRFCALTCAIKMGMLYGENVSERREEMSYELVPQLFELIKSFYER